MVSPPRHGGDRAAAARRLGCPAGAILDASASLAPLGAPLGLRLQLALSPTLWRDYPERGHGVLRDRIAALHGLASAWVLPGNGAAELFTWAARDAAAAGPSLLPQPGFADYGRALDCWQGSRRELPLPLHWSNHWPQPFPEPGDGAVLWITNPHNPTGQLWSRRSLEALLPRFALVICDEAFLPLVPAGEQQSLIPLLGRHGNLVVIRSLTKLYGLAGLRLGYALAHPERLERWAGWRDPWPLNGLAIAIGAQLLGSPERHRRWCRRVQHWTAREGSWLQTRLEQLPDLTPLPSAANFLLVRSAGSLLDLQQRLATRHRILLRDCRSFGGLDERWLRIGLQRRQGNRRLLMALRRELSG